MTMQRGPVGKATQRAIRVRRRSIWGRVVVLFGTLGCLLGSSVSVSAAMTRIATFENFSVGTEFKPAFTDPLSGLTFTNSTGLNQDFVIDPGVPEFGFSNELASGAIGSIWSVQFGFTAILPTLANSVSIDVSVHGVNGLDDSKVVLKCFDQNNVLLGQKAGPSTNIDPFTLQFQTSNYQIAYFQLQVADNTMATAYDNLAYTTAPEPAYLAAFFGLVFLKYRKK